MGIRRVLIADPDARAAALIARGLRKDGFEVAVASTLETAQGFLSEPVRMVFAQAAGRLDGVALCAAVRGSFSAQAPVILFSREADAPLRARARAAGADDLLIKPFYARDACTLARLFARAGGTEGSLSEQPLFFLLRALTSGCRNGEIELPEEKGSVSFLDGRIVGASCAGLGGEDAIARLLLVARGSFRLKLGPPRGRVSMDLTLRDLVLTEGPRRRRFEQAVALLGGETARLEVQFQAMADAMPKLPPSIERLVHLFDGRRTLSQALRACELEELTAAESILRLKILGVLTQASEDLEERPPPARTPEGSSFEQGRPLPDTVPSFIPNLHSNTQPEVRDWFTALAQPEGDEDVLAEDTGGWAELPAEQVGRRLLEPGGDDADREIQQRIVQLDRLQEVDPPLEAPRALPSSPSPATPTASLVPVEDSLSSGPLPGATAQSRGPEASPEDAALAQLFAASPASGAPSRVPMSQEESSHAPPSSLVASASPTGSPPETKGPESRELEALADSAEAQFFASAPEEVPAPHVQVRAPRRPVRARRSRKALILGACAVGCLALVTVVHMHDRARLPRVITLAAEKLTARAPSEAIAPALSAPTPALSDEGGPPSLEGPAKAQAARPEREGASAASGPVAGTAVASAVAPTPDASESQPSGAFALAPKGGAPAVPASPDTEGLLAEGRRLYASGQPAAAIGPFEAAAAAAPGDSRIQVLLALAHYDSGKRAQAGDDARRAISLDPGNSRAHLVLGTVYGDEGQIARARAEYEAYLKLAPNGEFARDVRTILGTLKAGAPAPRPPGGARAR